jgi:hypothetical protein
MLLAASPQFEPGTASARSVDSFFNPEFELLLEICRAGVNMPFQAPARGIHGPEFYRLADHHGLAPRVYEALSHSPACVPQKTLDAFRLRSITNARQTLWFSAELARIAGKFRQAGIGVLAYKGPTLAQMLYGDVSSRQYSDLDLLVHPADVRAAQAILRELGYDPHSRFTEAQQNAYLRSGYECVFDAAHGRNLIELQWRIVPAFYSIPFDVEGFFRRAIPMEVERAPLKTLSAEDLLLVLCAHAAKHGWTKLSWILDIAELSQSHIADWSRVLNDARDLGICRIVAIAFVLSRRLLQKEIPKPLTSLTEDPGAQEIAQELVPRLVAGEEYDVLSPAYFRLMLRARERWRERTLFLARLAFTPSAGEWEALRLPPALFPLYPLVRMVRLGARAVSTSSAPRETGPSR